MPIFSLAFGFGQFSWRIRLTNSISTNNTSTNSTSTNNISTNNTSTTNNLIVINSGSWYEDNLVVFNIVVNGAAIMLKPRMKRR